MNIPERIKVGKLYRMDPSQTQPGWWYYTPDGYVVGPFATEEQREHQIAGFYEERGISKLDELEL